MDVTRADYLRHFESLSDAALLETNRADLVELARTCYDEEVAKRGLSMDVAAEALERDAEHAAASEDLAVVATFLFPPEADVARAALQSASIPSYLSSERDVGVWGLTNDGSGLHLMVPAGMVQQAREVLEAGAVSDDELAAQAEAAVTDTGEG